LPWKNYYLEVNSMFKTTANLVLFTLAVSMLIVGCSHNVSNPISAQDPTLGMPTLDYMIEAENHESLGSWTAHFDLESMTASVVQNRDMSMRLNVKPYLPNPKITINSWNAAEQIVNVDIKITNPYNIHGFDLRLIVFTDNIGHTLTNDDGWTSLYDIPGGLTINPFKAYAKDATNRIFPAYSQRTENLKIKLPGMNPNVSFAIDASSPLNSPEPYQIANFSQMMLPDELNATTDVSFTVSRWNPTTSVSAWIRCADIFGGNVIQIPTTDNYHFEGTITNYTGAPRGEYLATIIAKTNLSPLYLYDMVTILVAKYPGVGWAVQMDDGYLSNVAADSDGNSYCAGYELGDLMKYDDTPVQKWSRNIKTEESYFKVNDLYFNDFLRVTGSYSQCTTGAGYDISMYGSDNTRYFGVHDCMYALSGAVGVSAIGDTDGYTYMSSAYGNTFWAKMVYYVYSDSLLTKFDEDGNVVWNQQFAASPANVAFMGLVFDGPSLITAAGFFQCSGGGGTVDFDPGPGEAIGYNTGLASSFLAQYKASDGSFSKVITWGSPSPATTNTVEAYAIANDNNGNLYVSGVFAGTIDFDPGVNVVSKNSTTLYGDIFISKFDSDWNFIKVIQLPLLSQNVNFLNMGTMACDRSGNVYYVGTFEGAVDFDPDTGVVQKTAVGGTDIFCLKLNSDLEFEWVQTWGSSGDEIGYDVACNRDNGNIYIVGSFEGTIDADPGPNVFNLTPVSAPDSVLIKLLPNGYWE